MLIGWLGSVEDTFEKFATHFIAQLFMGRLPQLLDVTRKTFEKGFGRGLHLSKLRCLKRGPVPTDQRLGDF